MITIPELISFEFATQNTAISLANKQTLITILESTPLNNILLINIKSNVK